MDRHTLSSRLARIGDELPRLSNTINAMAANTGTYGKNYEELSLDAARRAERIACSLRNLIYAADLVPKPVLMEAAAQVPARPPILCPGCPQTYKMPASVSPGW